MRKLAAFAVSMLLPLVASAQSGEICVYMKEDGTVQQVNSRTEIPARYLTASKCITRSEAAARSQAAQASQPPGERMAAPDEIEIKGATGHAQLSTSLGPIDLRWPRAVNDLFGRTPERAVADAAMAVSRALQSGSFSSEAQAVNQPWKIIFMDANLPEGQIPSALISACHPGWMTPPANIYVVAQRAAEFCSGSQVPHSEADSRLATILIHEMGHAIEYQLLKGEFDRNRMRAEGFAAWFEQYASGYSSVVSPGKMRTYYGTMARTSFANQPPGVWAFGGTAPDYARASMFFNAIVARRGVSGLMDVYRAMAQSHIDLYQAIQQQIGWNEKKLNEEAAHIAAQ